MHEYGIIKDGNFNSYKNILLENIRDIVNGNYIQNHRWYDLFNGLNGNLTFYYNMMISKLKRKSA